MSKIAMVVFSRYPEDVRVRREAETLFAAGMSVDVICLGKKNAQKTEEIRGVYAHRIRLESKRASKFRYISEYTYFILASFIKLTFMHLNKRYDVIHVHNMPDILIVSALFPKLTGAKIVLDLHDVMPELFETIYSVSQSHPIIKVLIFLERFSIYFADFVITPNISFRNTFIKRGCPSHKIQIVMNSPDEKIFGSDTLVPNKEIKIRKNQFNIMYHGTIVERHGLKTAIEAADKLRKKIPNIELHVFGAGEYLEELKLFVHQRNLTNIVKFHGLVSLETIAIALKMIDIGLIPNKKSPFTNLNFPVRIFEYLYMGKPVIVPKTQGITDYFNKKSMHFFEEDDPECIANSILEVYKNPIRTKEIVANGQKVYNRYRWEIQKKPFVLKINDLIGSITSN